VSKSRITESVRVVGGPRVAYQPILQHEYKEQIDEKLFIEHIPAKQVYQWLVDNGAAEGMSYHMLWRYASERKSKAMEGYVISNATEAMRRNYETLDSIVSRYLTALQNGAIPSAKDTLTAIKLQQELIDNYGGSPFQIEEDAKEKLKTIANIIRDIMDENQIQQFMERVMNTPELADWVLSGDE